MRPLSLLFFLLAVLTNISAQDSLLTEFFAKAHLPLNLDDGVLAGPGAEFFDQIGQEASFFLIGENHGMAEIPAFTAALFEQYKKHDYRYFATETGPYTAAKLEAIRQHDDWQERLAGFFKELPWSIPFYAWEEEWAILETVGSSGDIDNPLLWGIDQEFAVSFRMFFQQLAKQARNEKARDLANEYYEQSAAGLAYALEHKNPTKTFMFTATDEDFSKLRSAFAEQPQAVDLIDELQESIGVYQLWNQRQGFKSNEMRAELMKRYFREYYTQAREKDPNGKVMFKLGANHVYRGANGLNVFDIGNYVNELASQEGKKSFHLYVMGLAGTQNAFTPFSQSDADKKKPYQAADYLDRINFSPLFPAVSREAWSVIDLRPLRSRIFSRQLKVEDEGMKKLIFSYDAVLVIPEVTASTLSE